MIKNIVISEDLDFKPIEYLGHQLFVPSWVKCVATDSNGKIFGYRNSLLEFVHFSDTFGDVWDYSDAGVELLHENTDYLITVETVDIGFCNLNDIDWKDTKIDY